MRTFIKRALWGALIAGGVTLLGATAANAAETTGDDGLLSGTQVETAITAPISVVNNAISVLGDAVSTAPARSTGSRTRRSTGSRTRSGPGACRRRDQRRFGYGIRHPGRCHRQPPGHRGEQRGERTRHVDDPPPRPRIPEPGSPGRDPGRGASGDHERPGRSALGHPGAARGQRTHHRHGKRRVAAR